MEDITRPLSRRDLLRISAAGAGFATLAPFIAACGGDDSSESAAAAATAGAAASSRCGGGASRRPSASRSGSTTRSPSSRTGERRQGRPDADGHRRSVIPQFTNAAAAGKPPDVQFLFNGIYHMENVWLGYIEPLDGLVSADVLDKSGGDGDVASSRASSTASASTPSASASRTTRSSSRRPGSTPTRRRRPGTSSWTPATKLKAAGIIPIGGGVKDGFFGEWYFVNSLTQNLDSPADALNLFIGELDWNGPEVPRALGQAARS